MPHQDVKLRDWQIEALRIWERRHKGVVAVVTGGGKTLFALVCMERLWSERSDTRVLVLVPSLALQDQWILEINEYFLTRSAVPWTGRTTTADIVVMVMNSARTHASTLLGAGNWFLVVDECHRVATAENAKALSVPALAALGLSATPERQYDDNAEKLLFPILGPIIYTYSYREALVDGVIVPFRLSNYRIPLTEEEQSKYDQLSIQLGRLLGQFSFEDERVKKVLLARSRVVQGLSARIPTAVALIIQQTRVRSLVFHESTKAADQIGSLLLNAGQRAVVYHSKIPTAQRRQSLYEFRSGMQDVLICCRALDEGLNVPRTEYAVVASGTASARQRIQRLGRVLRPHSSKSSAEIATIYGTQQERKNLEQEAEFMAGLVDARWYGTKT